MQIIDLNSNFKGELEIVIREKKATNEIAIELHVLSFSFEEILSLIPLGQYDEDSVIYNYFKGNAWYDSEWECKRVQEFYNQLLAMNGNVPSQEVEIYNAIKSICNSTLINNNRLFIELV